MDTKEIMRLAKQDPELRAKVIEVLKEASRGQDDAAAFAAWCKMTNPMGISPQKAHEMLEDCGIPVQAPIPKSQQTKKARSPLQVGNIVELSLTGKCSDKNRAKCAELSHSGELKIYYKITKIKLTEDLRDDPEIVVKSIDGSTGRVVYGDEHTFYGVVPARSQNKQNKLVKQATDSGDPKKLETALRVMREMKMMGSAQLGMTKKYPSEKQWADSNLVTAVPLRRGVEIVCIYERGMDTPTPEYRKSHIRDTNKQQVRETVMRGEFRDLIDSLDAYNGIYYEGDVTSAAHGKRAPQNLYFRIKDLGRGFTTISPAVGKLYWIGKKSDMPRNWKTDLRERLKAVVEDHLKGL